MNPGYQADKPETIQKMFNQIAKNYDLANHVLSLGTHLLWKKKLVAAARPERAGARILDCATGTGDIAFMMEKKYDCDVQVVASDFSEEMLKEAKVRADRVESHVQFQFADIENLPFGDGEFSVVTISFGLRNVRDTKRALSEMARVTKKGGKVLVLEFGQPTLLGFKNLYAFYSQKILPTLGGWISGEKNAYQYLNQSSSKFPCGKNLCEMAQELRLFSEVKFESLSGGIAYLYQFKV